MKNIFLLICLTILFFFGVLLNGENRENTKSDENILFGSRTEIMENKDILAGNQTYNETEPNFFLNFPYYINVETKTPEIFRTSPFYNSLIKITDRHSGKIPVYIKSDKAGVSEIKIKDSNSETVRSIKIYIFETRISVKNFNGNKTTPPGFELKQGEMREFYFNILGDIEKIPGAELKITVPDNILLYKDFGCTQPADTTYILGRNRLPRTLFAKGNIPSETSMPMKYTLYGKNGKPVAASQILITVY